MRAVLGGIFALSRGKCWLGILVGPDCEDPDWASILRRHKWPVNPWRSPCLPWKRAVQKARSLESRSNVLTATAASFSSLTSCHQMIGNAECELRDPTGKGSPGHITLKLSRCRSGRDRLLWCDFPFPWLWHSSTSPFPPQDLALLHEACPAPGSIVSGGRRPCSAGVSVVRARRGRGGAELKGVSDPNTVWLDLSANSC